MREQWKKRIGLERSLRTLQENAVRMLEFCASRGVVVSASAEEGALAEATRDRKRSS